MTLSKQTLEPVVPAAKAAESASAAPSTDSNRLRADAVSLDVPVKVHGSRVTEVRGAAPQTEPFEEEASTMIVFPHGGVVRLTTTVSVGQMLVLTNLRTNQDAICRVVKVRNYSKTQAYVEVEFTHRQAGYWGVHFPADDEESSNSSSEGSSVSSSSSAETEKKPTIAPVTMKLEPLPRPPAAPARPESPFASFGSKEEVQPAATQMEPKLRVVPNPPAPSVVRTPTPVASAPAAPTPIASVAAPVARTPVAPIAAVTPAVAKAAPAQPVKIAASPDILDSLPVADEPSAAVESPRTSSSFGTFTGGISQPSAASSDFDARLDSASAHPSKAAAPSSGNWKWMAACALFAVLGVAAGAFYFRQHSPGAAAPALANANSAAAMEQSAAPSQSSTQNPVQNAVQNQVQSPIQSSPSAAATNMNIPEPSSASVAAPAPALGRPSHAMTPAADQTAPVQAHNSIPTHSIAPAPAPAQVSTPAPVNFAASAARPVNRNAASNMEAAAPSVGVAPAGAGVLPDVLGASNSGPAPPPVQPRIGGQMVTAKLTKSVPPIYPTAARSANISGNVVISAQVDKQGNVGSMKVLSGPTSLQMAAMSALKQWKYSPATLDGEPVATQVTVTIKFEQQ